MRKHDKVIEFFVQFYTFSCIEFSFTNIANQHVQKSNWCLVNEIPGRNNTRWPQIYRYFRLELIPFKLSPYWYFRTYNPKCGTKNRLVYILKDDNHCFFDQCRFPCKSSKKYKRNKLFVYTSGRVFETFVNHQRIHPKYLISAVILSSCLGGILRAIGENGCDPPPRHYSSERNVDREVKAYGR